MTLAFYLDEDSMDVDLIEALRTRHIDVVTAIEVSMLSRSDDEHLDYAVREARVLYSANARDFCRIHTERMSRAQSHAGIVVVEQQRYSIGTQLRGLLRLSAHRSTAEMRDRLEFLSNWI